MAVLEVEVEIEVEVEVERVEGRRNHRTGRVSLQEREIFKFAQLNLDKAGTFGE